MKKLIGLLLIGLVASTQAAVETQNVATVEANVLWDAYSTNATGVALSGTLDVSGDPATGEGVGNRDYDDARYTGVNSILRVSTGSNTVYSSFITAMAALEDNDTLYLYADSYTETNTAPTVQTIGVVSNVTIVGVNDPTVTIYYENGAGVDAAIKLTIGCQDVTIQDIDFNVITTGTDAASHNYAYNFYGSTNTVVTNCTLQWVNYSVTDNDGSKNLVIVSDATNFHMYGGAVITINASATEDLEIKHVAAHDAAVATFHNVSFIGGSLDSVSVGNNEIYDACKVSDLTAFSGSTTTNGITRLTVAETRAAILGDIMSNDEYSFVVNTNLVDIDQVQGDELTDIPVWYSGVIKVHAGTIGATGDDFTPDDNTTWIMEFVDEEFFSGAYTSILDFQNASNFFCRVKNLKCRSTEAVNNLLIRTTSCTNSYIYVEDCDFEFPQDSSKTWTLYATGPVGTYMYQKGGRVMTTDEDWGRASSSYDKYDLVTVYTNDTWLSHPSYIYSDSTTLP